MIMRIITSSFPFPDAAEHTFLTQELSVLCGLDDVKMKLFVVPGYTKNNWTESTSAATSEEQQCYTIDYSLLKARKNLGPVRKLWVLVETLREMRCWIPKHQSPLGTENLNLVARFRTVARFADQYVVMRYALRRRLLNAGSDEILCTWWLNGYTNALIRHHRHTENAAPFVVSRAHGGDLFPDQGPQVRQLQTVNGLTRVFPSTRAGFRYLTGIGVPHEKIEVARLGTTDVANEKEPPPRQHTNTVYLSSDSLTVVTISSTASIKRLPMLAQHLSEIASIFDAPIRWVHYGQPIMANDLHEPMSIIPTSRGWLTHEEMFSDILAEKNRTRCVAVSYSASEGTCLSLVEAACLGIPLVGCNVGGVPEIVTSRSGVLLPESPTPEHLKDALQRIYENYDKFATGARKLWEGEFAARNVYQRFYGSLRNTKHRETSKKNAGGC
jgi:glycosyltransferase involved in cell wall biosynthesis